MKVKCVDKGDCVNISVGTVYDVIKDSKHLYEIINDIGMVGNYSKCFFKVVEEDTVRDSVHTEDFVRPMSVAPMSTKYEERAIKIGQLVDKKNKQYGDSVNATGEVLRLLFPDGIKPAQYNDLGVIVRVWDKLKRIANGNQGEENAWQDIAGYAILMAKEDDF